MSSSSRPPFYHTAADILGFMSTAGFMVFVVSLVLGVRLRLALPLALLAPIGAQLLFGELLGVALPPGLLSIPW